MEYGEEPVPEVFGALEVDGVWGTGALGEVVR